MTPAETLLLDASSLLYRAFFALPRSITGSDGKPVNAVRGFLDMTSHLITARRPAGVVAVLDEDWRLAFRVSAYPGYKAARPDEPEEITVQLSLLKRVLDAAGVARAVAEGLEADDVIATLAQDATVQRPAAIVTGDRDLLCLVRDPSVKVLFTVRGVKDLKEFDAACVEAQYGVRPEVYPELALLRGDPSDGLPGVAGVGPKKAADLLSGYGTIDGILDAAGELPSGMRAAFEKARDYLERARAVVELRQDADVTATEAHPPDEDALARRAESHNLASPVKRLLAALGRLG